LLPGSNPHYSSISGFIGSVAIQALIVWRLWHGSLLAWFFALLFATLTPVSLVLMAAPVEFGVVLLLVVSVAQAVILLTRPIRPVASKTASDLDPFGR
jgi:hypothetical protein